MALKPWYQVVTPREDLREGKPLDASEFAVHLDQVRDGQAPAVYQKPIDFFERTYLTKNLLGLAAEVIRRLSGIKVETSAVFNMTTQFGGGKTHSLALLYHLVRGGPQAAGWKGVRTLLQAAGVKEIPQAATAVFVGTEFDSIAGRGGDDGTPVRKTPWGEIAWQLGGAEGFGIVAEHDAKFTAPGGDVVGRILPAGQPVLILLDELMNYASRNRSSGLGSQLYNFLQNLSEAARSRDNVALAVSIPASELEMTAEDQSDHERYKKLLDRLGKAVILSVEAETSEIIRRRLFEWFGPPQDAKNAVGEYADWMAKHRHQLPNWFPAENVRETLTASYPFHPSVLSVFERKWQALPRFQQTRGILRLLALWVSHAYTQGYKGAHKDPLISLGTAPIENPTFRAALFEQLGEQRLEGAVTTDIVGNRHAHALRLDKEAIPEVKKARLHRKVATAIFFESNGGQQQGEATLPEVRLAVAEPNLDIGNIEQSLDTLADTCYFLSAEKNRYRFSFQPNLNKLLADRRASIPANSIRDRVRAEIQKVFAAGRGVERIYFPERTNQVPDRAALTLVVLAPENNSGENTTAEQMKLIAKEHGLSSRTYKSALIWCVAEDSTQLAAEARKVLAWEDIDAESETLRIDESRHQQLEENLHRAKRDLTEAVWRSYKNVFLLDEKNDLHKVDLGLVHSSAAKSLVSLILNRLEQDDLVVEGVSPNFLVRNWPPALPEWSTKAVRDAFYASPKFPRLRDAITVKQTICRGVEAGIMAYGVREPRGDYDPFVFRQPLNDADLEINDEALLIKKEDAEAYIAKQESGASGLPPDPSPEGTGADVGTPEGEPGTVPALEGGTPTDPGDVVPGFRWVGEIAPQKWMNFYTKVLARFAMAQGLKLTLTVEVQPKDGVSKATIEETKVALRELGMTEDVEESGK